MQQYAKVVILPFRDWLTVSRPSHYPATSSGEHAVIYLYRWLVWGVNNVFIPADTVRRRLRSVGLRTRRPYVGSILLNAIRVTHYTRQHIPDESGFYPRNIDRMLRLWFWRGEQYKKDCDVQTDRWGWGRVMVWGGNQMTELHVRKVRINVKYYRDHVLRHNQDLQRFCTTYQYSNNQSYPTSSCRSSICNSSNSYISDNGMFFQN